MELCNVMEALLVLNRYCRSKILWVMPTSVYIPNTDRSFLLSLYLVFKLLLFLCVLLLYDVSGDWCKWRYPRFVTLILNK